MILDLEFDTIVLEKSNDVMVIKLGKDAIEETPITWNTCKEVVKTSIVSDITTSASGTSKFLAKSFIFFNQKGLLAIKG